MLENLSVRNYVLIDSLDISFNDGFSVLTGETGSGKSIMLGALSLLLGAKTDKEAVRQGESSAEISGIFATDLIDADNVPISFENFRIPETSLENAEFIAFKLDDRLFNARTALSASADNCIFKLSTVPSATIPPPNF